MPKTTWTDEDYAIGEGSISISVPDDYGFDARVYTPWGIVDCWAERTQNESWMGFIHGGRVYHRSFNRAFTVRGLMTKAKAFAREIAEKED